MDSQQLIDTIGFMHIVLSVDDSIESRKDFHKLLEGSLFDNWELFPKIVEMMHHLTMPPNAE